MVFGKFKTWGGGYCDAEGRMGFYYKDSEIFPPLPGEA
jgi:hypothetical protein